MNLEFVKKKAGVEYIIDGAVQWSSGEDYFRYNTCINRAYGKLFPENKISKDWKNVLIVGGGDYQILSSQLFVSSSSRITLVDPMAHIYIEKLIENKDIIPPHLFRSQMLAYREKDFLSIYDQDILTFLSQNNETYDFIVCDLTDELAIDVENHVTSSIYSRLRNHGHMIGYGGLSLEAFMRDSIIPYLDLDEFAIFQQWFPSWNDYGVFYGLQKSNR